MTSASCPFCHLDPSSVLCSNRLAVAVSDGFPVTPGHSLIIPKRHIVSFFDATPEEQAALFEILGEMRLRLLTERQPDGFNFGVNDGAAAGQTVMHLHLHLIPRYLGDTADPRGGVRWIMPEKAPYWKSRQGPELHDQGTAPGKILPPG
jgi:diadenosine tetraphosphate (Ap4A) HIT family hydrolase